MSTPKPNDFDLVSGPISAAGRQPATLYVSIVCAVDGARFAAVASSEQGCLAQVATYVSEQAAGQLKAESATRVRELLEAGDAAAAVAEYFQHTGERWEPEWLVTTALRLDPRSSAWSGAIPLPESVPGWNRVRLASVGLPH